ncbi:LysR substrate-binding domain-containing protein [Roseibium marinum]|uniref:DNA-binding transcriptional LysR family regulator n=1 Tax=Roseibium marinum TaxID=281252 RepID=A0A2S3V2D6_9HYPH|nr:LysR substrate-binding domain-containing protein [Roseibium marinum]POF34142.1 DNA-binding transcriptional LysR family regulator [Roseibium marinum]
MSVTLPRIRAVNAVAAGGSYAAAARALKISQPAVARHVKDLETEYGVRLFDRKNGILSPTPLCNELCDIAERMEEAERAATRLLTRHNTLLNGRLVVGLGNSMPGMALIALFLKRHPSIEIAVETGSHEQITRAVLTREVDIGVLPDVPADGRFRRELLARQNVVAIVHPDSPLSRENPVTCERLMAEPLIFRTKGSSTQRVVDRAFRTAGFEPSPLLTLDTRDAVYEAVVNGLGVGFMWRFGTGRTDIVHRVSVTDMHRQYEEAVFSLTDERNLLFDAFYSTVTAFRSEAEVILENGKPFP